MGKECFYDSLDVPSLLKSHDKVFVNSQLQVPDEALSLVVSMGFREHDARRALRMNNQDVGAAIDFLVEEKAKRMQKREEDRRRQREIMWGSSLFHTHVHVII